MNNAKEVRKKWLEVLNLKRSTETRIAEEIFDLVLEEFKKKAEAGDLESINLNFFKNEISINKTIRDTEVWYENNENDNVEIEGILNKMIKLIEKTENFHCEKEERNPDIRFLEIFIDAPEDDLTKIDTSREEDIRSRWIESKKNKQYEADMPPAKQIYEKILDEFERQIERGDFKEITLNFSNGEFHIDSYKNENHVVYAFKNGYNFKQVCRIIDIVANMFNSLDGYKAEVIEYTHLANALDITIVEEKTN